MKLSASLADRDVEFLDEYARVHGFASRSAVLQKAVRLLRDSELASDYAAAWDEWEGSDDAAAWDVAVSDGLPSD